MKKILFLFFILFSAINIFAEQKVGEYFNNYFDKNFEIEASEKNGNLQTVFIGVVSEGSSNAFIAVEGKDLDKFKNSLELVKAKYIEWKKIAIENQVTEMNKEFGIEFPKVEIYWLGTKWWSSYKVKVNFRFMILDDGKMVATWVPKVTHWDNKYIDETVYFVFSNTEDFDNLISQLNYQDFQNKLSQKKKNEDLFK